MAIVCVIFSPGVTYGSYNPQERRQSWKPLGYLRLPFREATYAVLRLPGLQQGSNQLCRGSHTAPQPMEGAVSPHLLSLHAPDHSSSHIWGLHAAPSASLQALVTLQPWWHLLQCILTALISLREWDLMSVCPLGRAQAVNWGGLCCWQRTPESERSCRDWEGAVPACRVCGRQANPVSRKQFHRLFPGTAGDEVRGKRSRYPHATSAEAGCRHPLPPQVSLRKGKMGDMATSGPLRDGAEAVASPGEPLRGLGYCVTQGRTRIKGCGSLGAPPFPLPVPLPGSAPGKPR